MCTYIISVGRSGHRITIITPHGATDSIDPPAASSRRQGGCQSARSIKSTPMTGFVDGCRRGQKKKRGEEDTHTHTGFVIIETLSSLACLLLLRSNASHRRTQPCLPPHPTPKKGKTAVTSYAPTVWTGGLVWRTKAKCPLQHHPRIHTDTSRSRRGSLNFPTAASGRVDPCLPWLETPPPSTTPNPLPIPTKRTTGFVSTA
jgi:hypothetical protein